MKAIGIIGTGEIGRRMGRLLVQSGRDVVGYDVSKSALENAVREGIKPAQSIADLCRVAGLVITCVTDGAALRELVEGPDGLKTHLPAGTPVVDTTSAEPWISRGIAAALAARGIPFLDAPVSGGVPAAEVGRMNFMVGGDAALLQRLRPFLEVLGPTITHVGAVGSGHTVKAVNMLALASSMVATAELVSLGIALGFELPELVDVLGAGVGASYSTRIHYPRFIVPGNFASGFTFDLMLKDLSIGIELANRVDLPLYLLRSTFEIYRAALRSGLAGKDNTRIVDFRLRNGSGRYTGEDIGMALLETMAAGFNAAIAVEALSLGVAAGLSSDTIIDVLSASSGDSHALSRQIGPWLKGAARETPMTIADILSAHDKPLTFAIRMGIPVTLLFQSFSMHCSAQRRSGADADSCAIVNLIAEWTGQRMSGKPQP